MDESEPLGQFSNQCFSNIKNISSWVAMYANCCGLLLIVVFI